MSFANLLRWVVIATLLLGCSPPGGQKAVTLRVLPPIDPAFVHLVSAVHERFPHIRLEMVPEEQADRADLVWPGFSNPAATIQSGRLTDLGPYIQRSRFDLNRLGGLPDQLRWEGKLYDLPLNLQPQVLVYNPSQFEAAGAPPPAAGWTWDEFRRSARQLTRGGKWGFWSLRPDHLLLPYVMGRGGPGDEKAVGEALRFLDTLIFGDGSAPKAADFAAGAIPDLFADGLAAMTLRQIAAVRPGWAVAPMPIHPGGRPAAMALVSTLGIASRSEQKEAAWQLLQFMAGPEGALIMQKAGLLAAWDNSGTSWTVYPRRPDPALEAATAAARAVASGAKAWEDAWSDYRQELRRNGGKG